MAPKRRKRRKRTATPSSEVFVGWIRGVFGTRGELKCEPTSAGREAFVAGAELRCERSGVSSAFRIEHVRSHKGRLLLRIPGVEDRDAARAFAGAALYAARDLIRLRAGEYLDDDLVGCEVENVDGVRLGRVDRVEHYPASDMLIVDGKMIPMVAAIVRTIDLAKRRISVDPPAGLME